MGINIRTRLSRRTVLSISVASLLSLPLLMLGNANASTARVSVTDDAFTKSSNPTSHYWSMNYMNSETDPGDIQRSYMRFVNVPSGPFSTASVTLKALNSGAGVDVYKTTSDFNYSTIVWNNQPGLGDKLGSIGPISLSNGSPKEVTIQLDASKISGGTLAIALVNESGYMQQFAQMNSGYIAHLNLDTAPASTTTIAKATTTTQVAPPATTTTQRVTTTTQPATTTTKAPTTTTKVAPPLTTTTLAQVTTTTTPSSGSTFLSYPHQSSTQTFSGSNVVVSNRSYQGFNGKVALEVRDATNVYLHDLDFADNGGDIFLINVKGNIRIENIRARNTGDGTIGSGHSNVIQFNNTWQDATNDGVNGIRHIKVFGGDTEDMVSIFQSGGRDASHPLVIEDIHLESPLPSDPLAWSSGSGTGINLGDAGGHDIIFRNSTILNAGAVGVQINTPAGNVKVDNVTLYGAARATSNVGLSQWSSSGCSTSLYPGCTGISFTNNHVFWQKANGSAAPYWVSHQYPITADSVSQTQDSSINPANLKVIL